MNYHEIRRKDRTMDPSEAKSLLEKSEYGFLAMENIDGGGYGIPVNYVTEEENIYIHCAPQGHKLENLRNNPQVTFCVVGKTQVLPQDFSTAYQSVLAFGQATTDLSEEERRKALWLIVEKYSPEYKDIAEKYIEKSFSRTTIIRIRIDRITAKNKIIK